MSHVFISYSRKNGLYARQLADFLGAKGFNVWMDDRIDYGDMWEKIIFQSIDDCAAFIVIMTPDSYDSAWVRREYHYAEKRKKPQFPLLLEGEEFPFYIATQYVDVRDGALPPEDFIVRLSSAVAPQGAPGKNVAPSEMNTKPLTETDLRLTPQESLLKKIQNPATEPPERLRVGIELAELGDPRPGVGVTEEGLPDLEWVYMEGGKFGHARKDVETFYISKYPVTYHQYQAFVEHPNGYKNPQWWRWMHSTQTAQLRLRPTQPFEQKWQIANHPRENITWIEAMAFCCWLSFYLTDEMPDMGRSLKWTVRLPTETEWECAAMARRYAPAFPWGDDYQSGCANINETGKLGKYAVGQSVGSHFLMQTTAVGVYPQGATPNGVMDLSGNVWEWTFPDGVVRGGAWNSVVDDVRITASQRLELDHKAETIGFRVVRLIQR